MLMLDGKGVFDGSKGGCLAHAPDFGIIESKSDDLRQTLQTVDEMIEEFYEIHAGLIRDEGYNP
jgi:hypothetical protein